MKSSANKRPFNDRLLFRATRESFDNQEWKENLQLIIKNIKEEENSLDDRCEPPAAVCCLPFFYKNKKEFDSWLLFYCCSYLRAGHNHRVFILSKDLEGRILLWLSTHKSSHKLAHELTLFSLEADNWENIISVRLTNKQAYQLVAKRCRPESAG